MNVTTKIDGKDITITLTSDQLKQIDEQRSKITHFTQIKSIEDACKVLAISCVPANVIDKIKTVAKAINSLISNERFPVYGGCQRKHYPYFEHTKHGWVFKDSDVEDYSNGQVALLKTNEAATYIGKNFLYLYVQMIEEY